MGQTNTLVDDYSEKLIEFFARCNELRHVSKAPWCLVAFDIQKFRLFNSLFGKEQGDALLSQIDDLIAQNANDAHGTHMHLGKDDFVAFLPYERSRMDCLLDASKAMLSEMGSDFGTIPAIGLYVLEEGMPLDIPCYGKALAALEEAKQTFINRVHEYDASIHRNENEEFETIIELRDAVQKGQLTFYLQPQCRISSGKIVGAEALVRWRGDDGKLIPPFKFIPVLEKHGFIAALDVYLWVKVMEWLRSLIDRGITPIPISLNISQGDITSIDVPGRLKQLCDNYDIPTHLIKIEITETSYAENFDVVEAFVSKMRSMGFLVLMDDFGSGYSSLSMLEHVSVDVLKLDMAFIKASGTKSRKGISIVESMVNMSKTMAMPIIVEGVEEEEQVAFLKNLGCRYAQGYYFYRPMPYQEFESLLLDEEKLDREGFRFKHNEQYHVREFLDENTFTDSMLNNVLGAVAFYSLEGDDLTITRFNEQFYQAIADDSMQSRQEAIQNYVVHDDWPLLYGALEEAEKNPANGGTCEIRFYKSDNSIFWFRMHFFHLSTEKNKKNFYGRVEDVTVEREQSAALLDVLNKHSEATMVLDLQRKRIQYVARDASVSQLGMPYIDLASSCTRTAETRITDENDRKRFLEFFDADRLESMRQKAIYHEELRVMFRLKDEPVPTLFSVYHIRINKDQGHFVYAFAQFDTTDMRSCPDSIMKEQQ